jgi:exopolyphosphatase/guanosine-5'-triphosphate,3'-diphosphate pyrophosphatase
VSTNALIPQYNVDHYAVVDLGSNSFHLLITRLIDGPAGQSMETVNKVKQKVRLAAGLNENLHLTEEAILRGVNCLKIFSQHLASIQPGNIIIVATAALRIAKNNDVFFQAANAILPKNIKLLSGEQEAQTIYAGVLHASAVNKQPNIAKKISD